ncbi:hypothetical protein JYU34_022320 [Plutella xylostella]|uniref:Uncharacterized protein n=1 Tax=Plutella xylostella TaxID=51655 RepID=A0ABQ7PQY6_PLUXY|nr:hypothetical protein JYU34_022320 [Plutella xylostella]
MPVTFRSLQEDFGAVVMDGYNILGDGSPATLFPLLTGRTELENPDRRTSVSVKESVDDLPFIFKRVRSHGYRTVYFEDHPNVGLQLPVHGVPPAARRPLLETLLQTRQRA